MHLEHDVGEGFAEGDDGAREKIAEGGDAEADAEAADLTPDGLPGEGLLCGGIVDEGTGAVAQGFAGGRATDAAGGALEESSADLFFEALDLFGQCGLRDVEPSCCASEVELFG